MAEKPKPGFPHAPWDWTPQAAEKAAKQEGLALGEDHWETIRALQEYFDRHAEDPVFQPRELHDALEEKFHIKGGLRHLYQLFPGGPVAQGCRLAGLKVPFLAVDENFGSVM